MGLVEETIKSGVEFLRKIKHGKVAIVHGHDNDSLCSAAIMYRLLKAYHKVDVKLMISNLNFAVSENVAVEIKKYKPDYVIIVDLADVSLDILIQMKITSQVLIIDHHKPKGYARVTYVNPRLYDPEIYLPATYLCYRIYEKFLKTKDILWVAGIGTLSDMGMKYCGDLFSAIKTNYKELVGGNPGMDEVLFDNSTLGKLAKIFDSARVVEGADGALVALNVLTKVLDYRDVINGKFSGAKKLFEWYGIVDKDFNRLVNDFQKKKKSKGLVLYEIKSKYNMKSPLSGYLSKFMQKEVLVIYQKSGKYIEVSFRRGKLSVIDLNDLAGKSIEKIPDAAGGGHPVASGARLPVKYLSKFLNNLKKSKI